MKIFSHVLRGGVVLTDFFVERIRSHLLFIRHRYFHAISLVFHDDINTETHGNSAEIG